MQFGDDIMGSATDEMRAMLQRKHQWKREFHAGRLKEHGMLPPTHRDPKEDVVDAIDRPEPPAPPPPRGRRMTEPQPEAVAEHFDIGYDTADEGEIHAPS